MRHMDEGLLQAWLDGPRAGLTHEERAAVEAHLAECPVCAERVETLRGTSDRVRDLMAVVEDPDEEIPPFDAVLRRAGTRPGESGSPASSPARPWWGRRTAWAASILVALGAGWLANEWNTATPDIRLDPLQVREAPASFEAGEEEGATADAVAAEPQADELDRLAAPSMERRAAGAEPPAPAVEAPSNAADAARARADASPAPAEQESRLTPLPAEPDPVVQLSVATAPRRATIRGRVVDEATGRPVEAAQVGISGTTVGTLTDADGRFRLLTDAVADSVADLRLAVEILGYRREELALARTGEEVEVGEVELTPNAVALDEVVVTGARGDLGVPTSVMTARPIPRVLAEDRWRPASMDEARDHIGRAVGVVPGLPVTGVHVGIFEEVPAVRVAQVLDDGSPLILIQSIAPVQVAPDGTGSTTAVVSDGLFVAGWAELPPDSLREVLNRVASN